MPTASSSRPSKDKSGSSGIPRVPFSGLEPALADQLRPRIERLGYLGEFFQCAANAPTVLGAFVELTSQTQQVVGERLTEVVALTIATLTANDYERHQHERLCLALGIDRTWVAQVEELRPYDANQLAAAERAAQVLALAVARDMGHGAGMSLAELVAVTDPRTAVAVLFLIGRYTVHSLVVNTLELEAPVPSPMAEGSA